MMHQNHPIRILHIHDFYQPYIKNFYLRNHTISNLSSEVQTKCLIKDAFSAIHLFTLYLPPKNFETELVVPQATAINLAWAKEHNINSQSAYDEIELLKHRIENFRPDILYFADPVKYNSTFIKKLTYKPKLVIGWKAADVPWNWDVTGYDLIFSGLPKLLAFASRQGAKRVKMFKPGMPQWLAEAVADYPKTVDVCFVGSIFPFQHATRIEMLDTVARAATNNGFSLALYLNCDQSIITPAMRPYIKAPVFGLEMHKALASAKIVIDDRAKHGVVMPNGTKKVDLGGEDTINMRLFEATGSGSFLLTQQVAGVEKYFDPGKEIDTWTNHTDLVEKIRFWLNNEKDLRDITLAGKKRTLQEHSMSNAAQKFSRIIYDALKKCE